MNNELDYSIIDECAAKLKVSRERLIGVLKTKTLSFDATIDTFLTVDECAAKLKCSRRTLRNRQKEGKAPKSIWIWGKEHFPTSHINEFLLEENPDALIDSYDEVKAAAAAANV